MNPTKSPVRKMAYITIAKEDDFDALNYLNIPIYMNELLNCLMMAYNVCSATNCFWAASAAPQNMKFNIPVYICTYIAGL